MKRRRKFTWARRQSWPLTRHQLSPPIVLLLVVGGSSFGIQLVCSLLMMSTNCLSGSAGCQCSWKSGKFVANCSGQSLDQVPNNDYYDYLLTNAGNNQMPTLNRDIQQLDLGSNKIGSLKEDEFMVKRFKNLQRIHLNANQLLQVHPGAFNKLTGLVELDLSENLLVDLGSFQQQQQQEDELRRNQSRVKTKSFLSHLAQLRHLNLASNQLAELREFAFSPAKELRQLYLSRNKISFIDKRAFDGLNVLNILHLDGNKLSYLNGEILAQLPKLHSLQLAGSNPWICDCRLRKLVRLLLGNSTSKDALYGAKASKQSTATTILQDEPRCLRIVDKAGGGEGGTGRQFKRRPPDSSGVSSLAEAVPSLESSTSGHGKEKQWQQMDKKEADPRWLASSSSWTNMKLDQLECPPRLHHQPAGSKLAEISLQMLMDSPYAAAPSSPVVLVDEGGENVISKIDKTKTGKQQQTNSDKGGKGEGGGAFSPLSETIATVRHHYLDDELIQLTCAFHLNDELDLDYSHLEWWLIMNDGDDHQQQQQTKQAKLIWSSRQWEMMTTTAKPTTRQKDEPAGTTTRTTNRFAAAAAAEATVMDYVTRARAIPSMNQSGGSDDQRSGRLVRVSHLIADAAKIGAAAEGKGRDGRVLARKQHEDEQKTTTMRLKQHQLEAELLCRITNQAGHAELLHSLYIDPNNRQAQLEAQARQQAQDTWLGRPATGSTTKMAANYIESLDRAKVRIAEDLHQQEQATIPSNGENLAKVEDEQEALFVPLYLSSELLLLDASPMNNGSSSSSISSKEIDFDPDTDDLSARSLSEQQQQQQSDLHQRQSTRQTNATTTNTSPTDSNSSLAYVKHLSSATYRQRLQAKALALIRRYTSQPDDEDTGIVNVSTSEATIGSDPNGRAGAHRLKVWFRSIYSRYMDRWLQLAIGEAPLLLGICAGLLIGCLLTTFFILRLHCAKQRRVRDLDSSSSCTRPADGPIKSSLSDGSATDSFADINSPGDNDDDDGDGDDAATNGGKKQHGDGSGTTTTTTDSQHKLISIPSPDDFVSNKEMTILGSATIARDGVALLSSSDLSKSNCRSDWASFEHTHRNYSTNRRVSNQLSRRLIVVSPEEQMQELILSPCMPFGDEQTGFQQPCAIDRCHHAATGWQSPYSHQDLLASSSPPSTTFQSTSRPLELRMTAPSKLRSNENLNTLYRNSSSYDQSSLSTRGDRATFAQIPLRNAAASYGYASSSSVVTSPAASTSSTSMTSGNPMMQHSLYPCNHDQQSNRSDPNDQHQHQNHVIYLDDALKLLHSSINDCLQ